MKLTISLAFAFITLLFPVLTYAAAIAAELTRTSISRAPLESRDEPSVQICVDESWGDCSSNNTYNRKMNLVCIPLSTYFAAKITSYRVVGVCCAFYEFNNCQNPLWLANNREDFNVGPVNNDRAWAYKCNDNCDGLV